MNLQPTKNRVFVKQDDEIKSETGVVVIAKDHGGPPRGVVIAIGPDVTDKTLVGKRVVFGKYNCINMFHQGEKFVTLFDTDIIGIESA